MNFIISQKLAQAILNYLIAQPYAQVFQLVAQLQNLLVYKEPEASKNTAD